MGFFQTPEDIAKAHEAGAIFVGGLDVMNAVRDL